MVGSNGLVGTCEGKGRQSSGQSSTQRDRSDLVSGSTELERRHRRAVQSGKTNNVSLGFSVGQWQQPELKATVG